MKRALVLIVLGLFAAAAHADSQADMMSRLLGKLHAGASCDDKGSALRPWCLAADGWATANTAPLPKAKVLVGITVTLVEGDVVETELREKVSLSALALRKDGARTLVKLAAITPSNDDESLQIAKTIGSLSMVLKGKAKKLAIPAGLADYLAKLPDDAAYEITTGSGGQGWTWTGANAKTELRKVGDAWIVIEPMSGGMYVTVLTDKL